ncbi:MAG TPA: HAMP domain-containing sensor histidine kinase, partial [Symbiobacteriaceae bacterium]|nr:HAMP domain-containing sensor histidine kinase [Symbiobacteriaceae bacterium]
VLELADSGPGLAPDEAGRVFDRFFQGVNPGQGRKGAGLGLAIVKSLVEAHGGSVGVDSTPGQGATFWVRLTRLPQ